MLMERAGQSPQGDTPGADALLVQLVEEHSEAVYRLARSVVRDPALADDVTQETFIKVWRHLDEFRGDGSIKSWIMTIAHRQSIAALRRVRDTATDPSTLTETPEPLATSRVVEGQMAYEKFQRALDTLDELSRSILVLRELEAMSYDDIARALDVPVPTVKTRLLRARRKLAEQLKEWR